MSTIATFGEWLKRQRRALGWTQAMLARHVGCATITIQKLEADDLRPSVQIAERLADHLGLLPEERLGFLVAARNLSSALRIRGSIPNHLPAPHTPLIGRDLCVTSVCATIQRAGVRLVTLTGPPGVGKSRVALQVAHILNNTVRDGAAFVSLASLSDPELVIASIAQALDLPEAAYQSNLAQLVAALHTRDIVLVLDNFEQVVAAAPDVSTLLEALPSLKILITSRIPLHISGEQQLPIPPLEVPDLQNVPPVDILAQVSSVALFIQQVQSVFPDFALTEQDARHVAAICERLDGLPLALELAAARSRLFRPQALLSQLQHPLSVLTVGARNLPAHQQTLRSTIAWSYDLLPAKEQALFVQLGVFVGSFSFDAIRAISCDNAALPSADILDSLACLVDHSLVQPDLSTKDEIRFRMLQTVRDYAIEQLQARHEADLVRERHARYYLRFAEQADSELRGPRQASWLKRLEQEHENIRSAVTWTLQHGATELGLQLAGALAWFWAIYGHVCEGYQWLSVLLSRTGTMAAPIQIQARALLGAGALAVYHGRTERVVAMLAKGAELSSSVGNRRDTGLAYTLLAMLATYNGDEAQAAVWHQQSLALMQEAVDPWGQAVVLGNHGVSAFNLQQLDQAVASLQAALALFQQIEDSWAIMYASTYLGLTLVQQGNYRQADQMLRNALGITRILGKRVGIPENLEGLAATAIAAGQIERAVRLAGAADALREIVGSTMSPGVQSIRANTLTAARKRLHEHKLAHAREAGRTMSLEQAIDYALHPIRTRSA